jgi:hypothetical protein
MSLLMAVDDLQESALLCESLGGSNCCAVGPELGLAVGVMLSP